MSDKDLIIKIPEPDGDRCNIECPVHYAGREGVCLCNAGLSISEKVSYLDTFIRSSIKPGPKCPQYQGDPSCLEQKKRKS